MSFPAAVQSAVFYFLACTPCVQARHHQKTRAKAKRERQEKAKADAEQPDRYVHPSPFNTNPYWQEEINMGPSLPKKSMTMSKNSSQRGLTSSGRDSMAPSVSERTNVDDSRLDIGDSMVSIAEHQVVDDDWNRRKGYQREDEELWGQWSGQKLMDAFSKARDSAGRLIDATLRLEKEVTEQERRDFYFSPKNPPVNEYHPPVVSSKHPSRDAHRWMLQPPPPAKIMEGKIPVSRAVSSGSKSSGKTLIGEEVNLGRLVHEKLVMEKLRKNSFTPTESELIDSLFLTRDSRSLSISRTRSLSFEASDDSLEPSFGRRPRPRLRPVTAPPGEDSSDDDDNERFPLPRSQTSPNLARPISASHAALRPRLETIKSTGSMNARRMSSRQKRRRSKIKGLSGAQSPVGDDTD